MRAHDNREVERVYDDGDRQADITHPTDPVSGSAIKVRAEKDGPEKRLHLVGTSVDMHPVRLGDFLSFLYTLG